jgi:hypothetical protein
MPKLHRTTSPPHTPNEKSILAEQPIEYRDPSSLSPHPHQPELFADMLEHELPSLADSIRERGLDHPIEVLPDGTIVCGHQRWRACRILGWSSAPVIVRHDHAAAGDVAVEERLITDNLDRRQLDRLDVARCYGRPKPLHAPNSRTKQRATPNTPCGLGSGMAVSAPSVSPVLAHVDAC